MKKLNFLFLMLLSAITWGQCPTGNLTLTTQNQVDSFSINYPGCTSMLYKLTISGTDIDDLSMLSQLTFIKELEVNNTSIPSFNGLANLTNCLSLKIIDNGSLVSLSGLENITSLAWYLYIQNNNSLVSLSGLDGIGSIGTSLLVVNNNSLTSLSGLDNISSVNTFVSIYANQSLANFAGLSSLTDIGSYLTIVNNNSLTSLSDLNANLSIGTNLTIQGNTALAQCEAEAICNYLASPNGTVNISNNDTGCDSQSEVESYCVPTTQVTTADCGTTVSSFTEKVYCDYLSGATSYQWEFTDPSLNVTTATKSGGSTEMTLDFAGLSALNTTYDVRVRAYVNGVWGNYDAVCEITSPAAYPTTQVRTADCGTTVSSFVAKFYCDVVQNATQYEWEFTDPSMNVTTKLVSSGSTQMTLYSAGLTTTATTYDVRVRAYSSGNWGNYDAVCEITSPASLPSSTVRAVDCGKTLTSFTELFYCEVVQNATKYEWEFTDPSMNVITKIKNSSSTSMSLSLAGISALSTTYDVRVRPYVYGAWGEYGAVCELTSPATAIVIADNQENNNVLKTQHIDIFSEDATSSLTDEQYLDQMQVYPNPFDEQVNLDFVGNNAQKTIRIYNSLGQVVWHTTTAESLIEVSLNYLDKGIYLLQVTSENENKTIRLVKH